MATRIPPPPVEERLPRFDTSNVLWYFGGITAAYASFGVVAAVSPAHRGIWTFLVALAFSGVYAALSVVLRASRWWVPGGVFAAVFVVLVPAVGIGFENLIGTLSTSATSSNPLTIPDQATSASSSGGFRGSLFALALVTVVVGLIVFAMVDFAFVLLPTAVATVVTAILFLPAVDSGPSAGDAATTLIVAGTVLVFAGLMQDKGGRRRSAFWWHVVGLGSVALGLVYFVGSAGDSGAWPAMLATGLVVLLLAAPLGRATWAAYGVAGAYAPLVHYTFAGGGTWRIPLILMLIGLAAIALGLVLRLESDKWAAYGRARLGL
jgi:hypothetical protein